MIPLTDKIKQILLVISAEVQMSLINQHFKGSTGDYLLKLNQLDIFYSVGFRIGWNVKGQFRREEHYSILGANGRKFNKYVEEKEPAGDTEY